MMLAKIHARVTDSEYKPWQVYLFVASAVITVGLFFELQIVDTLLTAIESSMAGLDWIISLGIQGVLIGFVAEFLYEQGDGYAKSASHLFGSKDRALFFRIAVMTAISGVITKVVPHVITTIAEYPVTQSVGATIVLGILLVHLGSRDWNVFTEWPALLGGALTALMPSLL